MDDTQAKAMIVQSTLQNTVAGPEVKNHKVDDKETLPNLDDLGGSASTSR